ncbi:FadR family transcriptional regulator [Archangium violaceum]|uniref:FadR/GntR family transcriptional regulator n=1 Tax=Archangium violaceum TaxID=83451 RepID=UPI00194F6600|nr:GntR family transcriptional regulator [Archangium violaceum]QRN97523.1 FadR family transcriptional regulator [Archangium violaceum]
MERWERTKLVEHIEEELEVMVARGAHPKTGTLPSERLLARQFGVARGTIREALLRLAARGLVVRRQGRQARAVALERAVTLESLSVALHTEALARPGRQRLLAGYFELKRQTTVELLVRCCEHVSEEHREPLDETCFWLEDGARRDEGDRRWVALEFELLRRAARAADLPGHFLLVQSLERAFWGMAELVWPHLAPKAVSHWVNQMSRWLDERDGTAMRTGLPPLLLSCDEHVLGRLWRERDSG